MDDPAELRNWQQLQQFKFNDEKYKTATSIDQVQLLIRIHLVLHAHVFFSSRLKRNGKWKNVTNASIR